MRARGTPETGRSTKEALAERHPGADLAVLERVDLAGCCPPVARMDGSLRALTGCRHLALSTNLVERIGPLEGLASLEVLSLGRNALRRLERLEPVGSTLRQLWVSYNSLESFSGIEAAPGLEVLYASNNRVSSWAEVDRLASALPSLQDLLLIGNPLQAVARDSGPAQLQRYRHMVVSRIEGLKVLDGRRVEQEEREAALALARAGWPPVVAGDPPLPIAAVAVPAASEGGASLASGRPPDTRAPRAARGQMAERAASRGSLAASRASMPAPAPSSAPVTTASRVRPMQARGALPSITRLAPTSPEQQPARVGRLATKVAEKPAEPVRPARRAMPGGKAGVGMVTKPRGAALVRAAGTDLGTTRRRLAEPAAASAEPVAAPLKRAVVSVEPVAASAETTTASAEPVANSAEPTAAAAGTEPAATPAEPTAATAEPTTAAAAVEPAATAEFTTVAAAVEHVAADIAAHTAAVVQGVTEEATAEHAATAASASPSVAEPPTELRGTAAPPEPLSPPGPAPRQEAELTAHSARGRGTAGAAAPRGRGERGPGGRAPRGAAPAGGDSPTPSASL